MKLYVPIITKSVKGKAKTINTGVFTSKKGALKSLIEQLVVTGQILFEEIEEIEDYKYYIDQILEIENSSIEYTDALDYLIRNVKSLEDLKKICIADKENNFMKTWTIDILKRNLDEKVFA